MTTSETTPSTDDGGPGFIRRHALALGVAAVAGTALVAWLAFGYFGIQTLWVDDEVDEAAPVFESGVTGEVEAPSGDGTDAGPPTDTGTAGLTPRTVASGQFVDRSHPAEGTAAVLTDGSEQRFLRFTEFATDNGPDVNVYLSAAPPDAAEGALDDDYVDLGDMKGNVGDQNYEIPPDVDLERYGTVVLWCVRFGVAFGTAPLAPA